MYEKCMNKLCCTVFEWLDEPVCMAFDRSPAFFLHLQHPWKWIYIAKQTWLTARFTEAEKCQLRGWVARKLLQACRACMRYIYKKNTFSSNRSFSEHNIVDVGHTQMSRDVVHWVLGEWQTWRLLWRKKKQRDKNLYTTKSTISTQTGTASWFLPTATILWSVVEKRRIQFFFFHLRKRFDEARSCAITDRCAVNAVHSSLRCEYRAESKILTIRLNSNFCVII